MLDYGNAINASNQIQTNAAKVAIYSYNDPVIQSESVDGDIRTYSIVGYGASDWNYIDLGAVYIIDHVNMYIGPGPTFNSGSFYYTATASGSSSPWAEITWVWTSGNVDSITGTYVAGTSGQTWGPVYVVQCSGEPVGTPFSARWLRFKASAGANRIYDVDTVLEASGEMFAGVYFSATSGGSAIDTGYMNTFMTTLSSAQQGNAGTVKTLYLVNELSAITSGWISIVNSTNLYSSTGSLTAYDGYYSIQVSLDNSSWHTAASGAIPISGIALHESLPIYFRYYPSATVNVGNILSHIRVTFTT